MLLEGALAVVVILACCAGVGMGKFRPVNIQIAGDNTTTEKTEYLPMFDAEGKALKGRDAWRATYRLGEADDENPPTWESFKLGSKIGAFVDGGANFLTSIGIPLKLGIGLIAVLVACFAATTLDSATRLQRLCSSGTCGDAVSETADKQICGNDIGGRVGRRDRIGTWRRRQACGNRRSSFVALVWGHKSIVGGPGSDGSNVLFVAAQ